MSSSISKKGLGRGLSSLMGDTKDVSIQNDHLLKMKKAQDFCSATWIRLKSY